MASDIIDFIVAAGVAPEHTGGELVMSCPLCSDHKKRLYLNQRTWLWICFNCSERGNLLTFLQEVCGLDPFEAYHHAQEIRGVSSVRQAPQDEQSVKVELPDGYLQLTNPSDMFEAPYWRYLADRGVGIGQVLYYKMGYTLTGRCAQRVIIPIRVDRELRGYVARAIGNAVEPKVLTPPGAKMSHLLFNLDHVAGLRKEEVVLVEGVFDALALGDQAVATLGAKLSPTQRHLLRKAGFKHVILMWDPDEAGKTGVKKVSAELLAAGFDVSIASLPAGTDPASASSVDLKMALQRATPVVLDSLGSMRRQLKEVS